MKFADKPWLHTGSFVTHLHKIIAKIKNSMEIPIGYQDKTGFHLSAKLTDASVQTLITFERSLKDYLNRRLPCWPPFA
jgi:hypothetical protein